MRSRTIKTSHHTMVIEEFTGMRELIGVTRRRPENSWSHTKNRDQRGDFADELDLLLNGWTEKTEEIMKNLDSVSGIKTATIKAHERYRDIQGYVPVVADALKGVPKAMVNSRKVYSSNSKIVEIIFDPGAYCGESAETVMRHGIKVLAKIKSLELAGYRVRLSIQGFKGEPCINRCHFAIIPIKEENQPLDLSRVAYPIASVEMLRTFIFYWYEHLPNPEYFDGYGISLYKWSEYQREEVIKALVPKPNQYYINLDTDVDKMFAPLLKKK